MEEAPLNNQREEELPPLEEMPHPLPIIRCKGEGYITRKDGTIVPFTLEGEYHGTHA